MRSVIVTSKDNLQQMVVTSSHRFISDVTEEDGGNGLGPTPFELLLASLGTCTGMTLLMYTTRKDWPLEAVQIELSHDVRNSSHSSKEIEGRSRTDIINRRITLYGDLSDIQLDRLAYVATRCPVSKILQSNPIIEDEIELAGDATLLPK